MKLYDFYISIANIIMDQKKQRSQTKTWSIERTLYLKVNIFNKWNQILQSSEISILSGAEVRITRLRPGRLGEVNHPDVGVVLVIHKQERWSNHLVLFEKSWISTEKVYFSQSLQIPVLKKKFHNLAPHVHISLIFYDLKHNIL